MIVAIADTLVALIAGMAIFPIVFANGLEPAGGPGLVFNTLPLAFDKMPFGTLIGTLFFVLLAFAAITSAISLLEPPVAWLVENKKTDRVGAACLCGFIVWVLGLGTVFSFNLWAEYKLTLPLDLGKVKYIIFENKSFFDIVDFLTANIMLPLGGLLIALFTAHLMKRESCEDELNIAPIAVIIIFLHSVGVFKILGIM
jgi:NSS family neurotransmitter:Na+ symporter